MMKNRISEQRLIGNFPLICFILVMIFGISIQNVSAGIVNLPRAGQSVSLGLAGYTCYPTASDCHPLQDANVRAGIYWSTAQFTNARFVVNNDGTVTDTLTGLMWLQDADYFSFYAFKNISSNNYYWSSTSHSALISMEKPAKRRKVDRMC